jgi:lipopolysaccharide cholinephosphotransferase
MELPQSHPQLLPKTILTQRQVNILYDILNRFDKTCTDVHVQYVMSGGTALGAIRHKGLIPWDDDGDLYMFAPQFYNKAMDLFTAANRHGLLIRPFVHGKSGIESNAWFKIYRDDGTDFPNVDIFVLERVPHLKQWVHADPDARTYFPKDYLTDDQVVRLYRTPFGPLNLWMFSNHVPYFDRNYGNDWPHVAWDGYDHVHEVSRPSRSNERRVGDYRPALPTILID